MAAPASGLPVTEQPRVTELLQGAEHGQRTAAQRREDVLVSRRSLGVAAAREDAVRGYSDRPPRHEYVLTALGRGALPVLAALQEFGDTWLLGDGSPDAGAAADSNEVKRVSSLVGQAIPRLHALDPVTDVPFTVVYCYPGNAFPGADEIPGGIGCTLESCTYRDRLGEFTDLGASVVGVSTQRPGEQAAFAAANGIRFPLLSDADLELTTALRLPTFRAGGTTRLKRQTLVVDRDRVVRAHPLPDPRRHGLGRGRPAPRP